MFAQTARGEYKEIKKKRSQEKKYRQDSRRSTKREALETNLWCSFQGALLVSLCERFDSFLLIPNCLSTEKLPGQFSTSEYGFNLMRILIDVASKQVERLGIGVPEPTSYSGNVSSN